MNGIHARSFRPRSDATTGVVTSSKRLEGLFFSASMKLSHAPQVVEMFTGKFGFEESALTPIGILEIVVTVLYLSRAPRCSARSSSRRTWAGPWSRTSAWGDPFVMPALLGVLAWGGLFLRDTRLRALLPLRR